MKSLIGSYLGHYKILSHLASGAMSDVYLGFDEDLQLHVAIKVITEAILRQPEAVDRFKREARAAARLNHPNVARVFFFNFKGATPFFAMELIEGVSLADLVERRLRFSLKQYMDVFEQAARGLRAAAVRGVIHRDIKPGNLMVGRDGLVKVVDFGLAKVGDDKTLTQTGTMMGTPYYLSPEGAKAEEVDLRSDIYSLGATMFHVAVGYPPYDADTPYAVMMKHAAAPVPHMTHHNDQLPKPLSDLVCRMMEKDREDRFPNYEAFLNALAETRERMSDRLDDDLFFCSHCDVNTVARRSNCGRCKRPYTGQKRPESYDLLLTSFRGSKAEDNCIEYISKAVGRREAIVRRTVANLPFKIGHRLPFEKAKEMQRRFYDLGGDVEMQPVRDPGAVPEGEQLEFISAAIARTASIIAPSPLGLPSVGRRWKPHHYAIGGLALLVAALGGVLAYQALWNGPTGDTTPVVDTSEGPAVVESPTEETTTEEEVVILLPVEVELVGEVPGEVVDAVRAAVEIAAGDLQRSCSWTPERAQRLVLDQTRFVRTGDDPRAWELDMGTPVGHFPVRDLSAEDPDLALLAAHWVARCAVAQLAGEDAPGWIALGLAFRQEALIKGLQVEAFEGLVQEQSPIPLTFWGASQGRNPPETIARSESMVEYLIDHSGPETFGEFLRELAQSSLEAALQTSYGLSIDEVMEGWQVFLSLRYGLPDE